MFRIFATCLLVLSACAPAPDVSPTAQFAFHMGTLCGQTYAGKVISDDPQDADWRDKILTLGPVNCDNGKIVMLLAVGDDRSRVWTLVPSATEDTIYFSHAHTLSDGSPDPVTGYGGTSVPPGTSTRQEFPADAKSKAVFTSNGLDVSVTNVWSLEIVPDTRLTYGLSRENRDFRAEFDLTKPL